MKNMESLVIKYSHADFESVGEAHSLRKSHPGIFIALFCFFKEDPTVDDLQLSSLSFLNCTPLQLNCYGVREDKLKIIL